MDAASSETRLDTIKEEFRREREALEARYREEIEALKNASEHWEEQLRTSYQEQEARHAAELESARSEARTKGRTRPRAFPEGRLREEAGRGAERLPRIVRRRPCRRSGTRRPRRELELQRITRPWSRRSKGR